MNPRVNEPDPYNYPFPTRGQLMSLSTINDTQDFVRNKVQKFFTNRNWNSNLKVDDISGAKTNVPGYQYKNKQSFSNQNWDIDRTGPRALHLGLNKPEYNLSNDDLPKSKPQFQKFQTKRAVNPLNPQYELPKTEMVPPDEPKFIRDNIANDDIDGAKPRKAKYFKTRETMKVDDIAGTKPKPAPKRSTSFNSFDYSDVTKNFFVSKRTTNPLNPSYFHQTNEGQVEEIGNIDGSKPKNAPERKRGPSSMNLDVDDIDGTKPGSKGIKAFKYYTRREFRETNKTGDIAGSQVGTLLKAPITNRLTNPLNPEYQLLGAKELGENYNAYNENISGNAIKPTTAPVKTREEKSKWLKIERQLSLDKEKFRRDVASFFGTTPGFMQEIDFKNIQKAWKPPVPPKSIIKKPKLDDEKQYNRDAKRFYDVPLSEASEMSNAVNKFYRPESGKVHNRKDLSSKDEIERFKKIGRPQSSSNANLHVNKDSQHYKRDLAKFYGEPYKPSDQGSSMGSIFQENAAEFYGVQKPAHGDKPFKINKDDLKDPNTGKKPESILNERRLKQHELNMQRNPTFGKNLRRFYGLKSQGRNIFFKNIETNSNRSRINSRVSSATGSKAKGTYAEQLDRLIG